MKNKNTIYAILVVSILIGFVIILTGNGNSSSDRFISDNSSNSNVELNNGVQIITISAKGGYFPSRTIAKANIPTIIRFATSNTFDCSRSVRLPSLSINKMLPQTGNTDIDIGNSPQGKFFASCSMGMYSFRIDFQ